jgi:hypothetical protein
MTKIVKGAIIVIGSTGILIAISALLTDTVEKRLTTSSIVDCPGTNCAGYSGGKVIGIEQKSTPSALPISAAELLNNYEPRLQLTGCLGMQPDGTTECLYRANYFSMQLFEKDGRLVKVYIVFDEGQYNETKSRGMEGVRFVQNQMSDFVSRISRSTNPREVLDSLRDLNLTNPWSMDLNETVLNGIKLRRYVVHGGVVVEAVPTEPGAIAKSTTRAPVEDPSNKVAAIEQNGTRQHIVDSENRWLSITGDSHEFYTYEGDRLILNVVASFPTTGAVAAEYYSRLVEGYRQTGQVQAAAAGPLWKASGLSVFVIRLNGTDVQVFPL